MAENEKTKKKNIHAGHRERVKARFDASGLDDFTDHQILEFLLFYAIPQRDTNEMAHNLLNEFGSISAVFDARVHQLEKLVGKSAARLIKLIMPIAKRYYLDRENYSKVFTSPSDIGRYVVNYFIGDTHEKIILLCFDAKLKLLNITQIAEGNVSSCDINNRLICETVLKYNASSVVLAHNHPGGVALPSREDMMVTDVLNRLLEKLDIYLYDHIVVGNRDFVSFRDSGMLRDHF